MAINLDRTSIIICSVIGSLGLLSAILGFSAEGTKLTPYTILVSFYDCIYPPNPAIGLGICGAIFLLVAQITFSVVGACCGCCRSRSFPSETKRVVGIVCAVFSWIAAVIAFALFIQGAAWNANVVRAGEAPYCPYLKDGIFAGAGVLALAATALGITSLIMQRSQPSAGGNANAAPGASAAGTPGQSPSPGVVVGQPLFPSSQAQNYPVKPQGYEQPQVVPPAEPHSQPHGYYAQAPQNVHAAPPPPAAQQNNVSHSHTPNHQLPPRPAVVAPAAVVAAAGSYNPLQVAGIPAPQVGGLDIPAVLPASAAPSTAGSGGSALSTVIRNEVVRQGIRMAAEAVTNSLFSDNTVGDLSMPTGSAGGDPVQATSY